MVRNLWETLAANDLPVSRIGTELPRFGLDNYFRVISPLNMDPPATLYISKLFFPRLWVRLHLAKNKGTIVK
jgi:hypothetical protein